MTAEETEYYEINASTIIALIITIFSVIVLYNLINFLNPIRDFFFYKLFFLLYLIYFLYIILQALFLRSKYLGDNKPQEHLKIYISRYLFPVILNVLFIGFYFVFMNFFNYNWDLIFHTPDLAVFTYILIFLTVGWFLIKVVFKIYIIGVAYLKNEESSRKVLNFLRFCLVELFLLLFLFHNITILKVDNLLTWIISGIIVTITMLLWYKTNTFDILKDLDEKEPKVTVEAEDQDYYIRMKHFLIIGAIIAFIVCFFTIPFFQTFIINNIFLVFSFQTLYSWVFIILFFITVVWWVLGFLLLLIAIGVHYLMTRTNLVLRIKIFIILFILFKLILFNMSFIPLSPDWEYYLSAGLTLIVAILSYKLGYLRLVI